MTVPESSVSRRFAWPADYYSSPSPQRVLPSWATFGCGGAAALVLVLIFAGGALLSGDRFAQFMDFAVGMSLGEMRRQFTAEVTPEQKKSLEAEIETMRAKLREGKISIPTMQPFLQALQDASSDRKVTPEEAVRLERIARNIHRAARR